VETAIKAVLAVIVLIILVSLSLSVFVTVPPGHRGVLLELGAVKPNPVEEGFHTLTPFTQSVVMMDVRTQKYEVDATASTKDLLDVTAKVAVNFHLDPASVSTLYQTIGVDYENVVIAPAVQELVKATTAKFNAEELITQRETVRDQIEQAIKSKMQSRNILVESISIVNFQFPQAFNEAITAKQTAVQRALEAQNKLEQIKFEAQQAVAKAEGDAQAIEIINLQLQKSPQYINYLAVNKWSGTLPLATGGAVPFINLGGASPPYNDNVKKSRQIVDHNNVIHEIKSTSKEIFYRNCTTSWNTTSWNCSEWFNITEV
jgi:regulator of protease activity HflC (stomatin/prohibitin superfamily)